jgi:hypothetical protein
MIKMPDLDIGKQKIFSDCDVKHHRVVAFAFTPRGHIICVETNRKGSGIVSDFSFHAEEFLDRKLSRIGAYDRYKKINILVARWAKSKEWLLAKPCPGCLSRLSRRPIDAIWYTDNGNIVKL